MVDTQPPPPFSRPLRKLTITSITNIDLIDQLLGPHSQYDEVDVGTHWGSSSVTQRIINGVGASVKRLNLKAKISGVSSVPKTVHWRCLNAIP